MLTGILKQLFKSAATVAVGASFLLAASNTQAAKPPPANPTCTISPADTTITQGQSVDFSATDTGLKGQRTYAWDFSDGPGVPDSSTTNPSGPIQYNNTGTFDVSLTVTDRNNNTASCSTTVNVNAGGGCTPGTPALAMGADQFIAPDGSAIYTLSMTNNDSAACADSTMVTQPV